MTTKISTLPTLATVTDATIIPVVEGGATKKITGAALKTYTGTASGPQGPSGPSGASGSGASAATPTALGTVVGSTVTGNSGLTSLGYNSAVSASGSYCVGIGTRSLGFTGPSTGNYNTAVGADALYAHTSGLGNAAFGFGNMGANTTGNYNAAFGYDCLSRNTTADGNAAFGANALRLNTTGTGNVAVGKDALTSNTSASNNTAVGFGSLNYNTTGVQNNALGSYSLYNVTTGTNNTAIGYTSGYYITSGSKNTIIGGYNGNNGGLDIRTASNYVVLSDGDGNPRGMFNGNGYFAASPSGGFPDGTNLTYHYFSSPVSAGGAGDYSLYVRADSASFAGSVLGTRGNRNTVNSTFNSLSCRNGNDTGVFIVRDSGNAANTNNVYGSASDISLKENIVDTTPKLNDLMQVQVRNYNLKIKPEEKHIGVIAQELEMVFPGLVETDNEGIKNVKYSVFVPMLIKAIQELKAEFDAYRTAHP